MTDRRALINALLIAQRETRWKDDGQYEIYLRTYHELIETTNERITMNDTKFIPGPWEFSGGNAIWATSPWNAKVKIAEIMFHAPMNGIDSKANGRLIAASADIFAKAEALLDKIGHIPGIETERRELIGALKKAVDG